MRRKRLIIIISIIIIIGTAYGLMAYFSGMKEEKQPEPPELQIRYVKAVPIKYEDVEVNVAATGRVASQYFVDISSEVQGIIMPGDVRFKKGKSFKKGDLLVKIFDKEARYNLQSRKSRFLTSIANILPDFKIDFPDSYRVWLNFFESIDIDKDLPHLPQVISQQEKIFLASRNILSDYYTIKSEEERFKKYSIYAPFNGSITQVYLDVGAVANPGSRLATIIQTDMLELEVPLEAEDVRWVSVGDRVEVTSEKGHGKWKGNVLRIADFVDPATQSISVFVELNSSSHKPVYQGQYMRAFFQGKVIENSMEIPRNAVFNSNEVFTVVNGKLTKMEVNVRKINEESLVFNGINEGIYIVVEPLINAVENTSVEILD